MAQSIIANSNNLSYGVKRLIVDTVTDLTSLPYEVAPGSTAFASDTGITWILNNNKTWVKRASSNTSGGSSGGDSNTVYIWDGGEV